MIDYIPDAKLVESKSLKLFLGSFRNHGAFHEDCTVSIARRLIDEVKPKWIRVGGIHVVACQLTYFLHKEKYPRSLGT